jgi:uncharacterized protein YdhG (YjbR/CyaY superfamily)
MQQLSSKFKTIDEYHAAFPKNIKDMLEEMRSTIRQEAPQAQEVISYNMPAFKQNGILVYYAAYKEHIGFYPTASPIRVFKDRLTAYKTSKGAIQFPVERPIPKTLIKDIVRYRINEDKEKGKSKNKTIKKLRNIKP